MYKYIKRKLKIRLEDFVKRIVKEKLDEEFDTRLQIYNQMNEFRNSPPEMLSSNVESKTHIPDLINRFKRLSVPIREEIIDVDEFKQWRKEYPEIISYYDSQNNVKVEKTLEHYLTMKFLNIKKQNVLIDIAACNSPFSNILSNHLGLTGYRLDLIYQPGIHGRNIGGDAGNMPVPDEFADILTLHCAFECFQGDADIRFVIDAQRVLKKGGCFGIVPLYIDDEYFVKVGPKYDKRKVKIEKDAKQIWRDDSFSSVPFSRHYSPESLKERVINNFKEMEYEIIHFINLEEISKHFPEQRIYAHFFFKAVKIDSSKNLTTGNS